MFWSKCYVVLQVTRNGLFSSFCLSKNSADRTVVPVVWWLKWHIRAQLIGEQVSAEFRWDRRRRMRQWRMLHNHVTSVRRTDRQTDRQTDECSDKNSISATPVSSGYTRHCRWQFSGITNDVSTCRFRNFLVAFWTTALSPTSELDANKLSQTQQIPVPLPLSTFCKKA